MHLLANDWIPYGDDGTSEETNLGQTHFMYACQKCLDVHKHIVIHLYYVICMHVRRCPAHRGSYFCEQVFVICGFGQNNQV